jgi:hypothetical protein
MYKYKFLILISLCLVLFSFNNCTLIGFTAGSIIDDIPKNNIHKTNEELLRLSPGTNIKLVTIFDDTLEGKYSNTTLDYSSKYIEEYNKKYELLISQFYIP